MQSNCDRLRHHWYERDSHGLQPPFGQIELALEENSWERESGVRAGNSTDLSILAHRDQNLFRKEAKHECKWHVEGEIDQAPAVQVDSAKFELAAAIRLRGESLLGAV